MVAVPGSGATVQGDPGMTVKSSPAGTVHSTSLGTGTGASVAASYVPATFPSSVPNNNATPNVSGNVMYNADGSIDYLSMLQNEISHDAQFQGGVFGYPKGSGLIGQQSFSNPYEQDAPEPDMASHGIVLIAFLAVVTGGWFVAHHFTKGNA